jgi:hypothetical protein
VDDNEPVERSSARSGEVADEPSADDINSVEVNGEERLITWGGAKWIYSDEYVSLDEEL